MATTKEMFINDIIPSVERMIEKSENHISNIQSRIDKMSKGSWYHKLFYDKDTIKFMEDIITAEKDRLSHYNERLDEYKEFADKLQ